MIERSEHHLLTKLAHVGVQAVARWFPGRSRLQLPAA